MSKIIAYIIVALFMLGIGFLVVSGAMYVFCISFDLPWAWKKALGVFVLVLLVTLIGKAIAGITCAHT